MYNYEIGYHSYEESPSTVLQHRKKFSDEEITNMVGEAILFIYRDKKDEKFHAEFEYMMETVICYLIWKKGFVRMEFEKKWSIFGWASLLNPDDWNVEDPTFLKIHKKLIDAGFAPWNDIDHTFKTENTLAQLCYQHWIKWSR